MKARLNIEFLAGEDIQDACLEAVRLANLLRVIASFDFNGVKVMAKPGVCPKDLAERWSEELRSKHQIKIACAHPSMDGARYLATGEVKP